MEGSGVSAMMSVCQVHEVVNTSVRSERPPVAGGEVLEELDGRAGGRPQGRDPEPSPEDVVQVLLLGSVVLALADDAHAERVAIEPQARFRVGHHDRRVVDAEEEPFGRRRQRASPLPARELQDLEGCPSGSLK